MEPLLSALVCVLALACSGTEGEEAAEPGFSGAGSGSMPSAAGASGGTPSAAEVPGMPGLEAPPDVAAPPADAELTASGLASKRLYAGMGTQFPKATDTVRVHYSGWQTNGVRFDSSVVRGMPLEFPLNMVIAGWTEGLQLMVEGEERRFWIPEELAYRGLPNYPAGMLVFDVQLLAILPVR